MQLRGKIEERTALHPHDAVFWLFARRQSVSLLESKDSLIELGNVQCTGVNSGKKGKRQEKL